MKKPTVSQLLDLLNKPALMKWANKIGLEGTLLEDYYKKSKAKGTSLHLQIEEYLKNKKPFADIAIQQEFETFLQRYNVVSFEQSIETEWFIGRYDIILRKDNDLNTVYLCDFKSNTGVYFENKLQLVAYRMALPYENVKYAVIEIPSFTLKEIEIPDQESYKSILKNLSSIFITKSQLC